MLMMLYYVKKLGTKLHVIEHNFVLTSLPMYWVTLFSSTHLSIHPPTYPSIHLIMYLKNIYQVSLCARHCARPYMMSGTELLSSPLIECGDSTRSSSILVWILWEADAKVKEDFQKVYWRKHQGGQTGWESEEAGRAVRLWCRSVPCEETEVGRKLG